MTDRDTGRMPLGLVFEWLQHEAGAAHPDEWVVPMALGDIRTLAAALRRLDDLENAVEDLPVVKEDGTVEERRVFHVELCEGCDCLRLTEKRHPKDGPEEG